LQASVKSSVSRPHYPAGDNGWLQKIHQPSRAVGMPISATKSALFGHGAMDDLGLLCAQERTWKPNRDRSSGSSRSITRAAPRLPKSAGTKGGGGETFSTGLVSRSGGRGCATNKIFNNNECRSPSGTLKALKRSNLHRLSAVISIAALIRLAAPEC
jgi:hypothetical protein